MRTIAKFKQAVRERAERRIRTMPPARRLRFELAFEALERGLDGDAEVLDAGCGEGLFAAELAARFPNWSVLGADLREDDLTRARALADGLPNARFARLDLTDDLGQECFDAVVALECLVEIPDDEAALARMAQALRSGGLFIAHVPPADWTPVLSGSERTWRHEVRHGYTEGELVAKLARAGLEATKIRPTTRGTVKLALELRDRIKNSSLKVQAFAYPWMLAAVRLERLGLTWGSPRGLLVEARRR
jgi:SAM-dependent methyltransferase